MRRMSKTGAHKKTGQARIRTKKLFSSKKTFWRSTFTLAELLIVIGIIAILSTIVILALNPAELIKQARDSERISDLATLSRAIGIYQTDTGGSLGTASTTYISVPDSSPTCANLGLPTPPSGYSYHCVASSTLKNTDGTGWVPINFGNISFGSPIANLPIDPTNTTSSGNYYTFTPGSWAITSNIESTKYISSNATADGGYDPSRYEVGSDLSLVAKTEGLAGWWNFEEGSGNSTNDSGPYGITGTLGGSPARVSDKSGGAIQFSGSNYINLGDVAPLKITGAMTISVWIKSTTTSVGDIYDKYIGLTNPTSPLFGVNASGFPIFYAGTNPWPFRTGSVAVNDGAWRNLVAVYSPSSRLDIYVNGSLTNGALSGSIPAALTDVSAPASIGQGSDFANTSPFKGAVDNLRIYNRALSSTEILNLYNAEK